MTVPAEDEWTLDQRWTDDENWYKAPPSVVAAAAGARRIAGLPDDQLTIFEDRIEQAVRDALDQVMGQIAARVAGVQTAGGREPWLGCRHGLHPVHEGPCP